MRAAHLLHLHLLRSVVFAAALLGAEGAARAERYYEAQLVYSRASGAEACPGELFLRDTTASRLDGKDPFITTATKRITLALRRRGRGFVAEAALYEGEERLGTRSLDDGNCAALVETMAMIFASWLTPVLPLPEEAKATAPPKGPEPAAEPPACAQAEPPACAPEPPKAEPPPARRWPRFVVDAGALAAFGTAPGGVAFGLAGSVGARWERVSLSAGVQGHLPASHNGSVHVSLVAATLAPCVHWGWFAGCGLLEGGALLSASQTDGNEGARVQPWFAYGAAGVRAGGDVPLVPDRVSLRITAELLIPWVHPTLTNDFNMKPWTMPYANGAVGARLVGSFGP